MERKIELKTMLLKVWVKATPRRSKMVFGSNGGVARDTKADHASRNPFDIFGISPVGTRGGFAGAGDPPFSGIGKKSSRASNHWRTKLQCTSQFKYVVEVFVALQKKKHHFIEGPTPALEPFADVEMLRPFVAVSAADFDERGNK